MRILFCNKYNYRFSGTEVYLFELMQLLRSQGHEVALFSMANSRGEPTPYDHNFVRHIDFKTKSGACQTVRNAAHAIYSWEARRRIRAMIQEFRPDVAHVRNIYHHLSPSILWELKAHDIPVLYHVNDFKLLCPSYNLVDRGELCDRCKGGSFRHVLRTECYDGGLGARVVLMTEAYLHRWMGTFRKCISLFVAPSQFVRDKFVEHGWDGAKFEVLPHFQEPHEIEGAGDGSLLYFGRLSSEKGVDDLLHAMKSIPHKRLVIAGDGPQQAGLQKLAATLELGNVEFVGHVDRARRDKLIARSQFTVLPSHAYETLGKTILESYAEGRAVIASDMGSRRELVRDGETGLLYPTGDVKRLAKAIDTLARDPDLATRMGRAGWEFVGRRYTPAEHYAKLLSFYERMVATKLRNRALAVTSGPAPWERSVDGAGRTGRVQDCATRDCATPATHKKLRVAFIGGRGVVSKYSGIETYYEEVGKSLAQLGHEVTVYCRTYFTPPLSERHGMRLVRLPTIRSKHFETVIHTALSTVHAMTQSYDVVHYHCLGPALFSFLPRLFGAKTAVTVQGLDWQRKKWGRLASTVLRLGERASARLPNATMVVSQVLQERYLRLHDGNTFYIPNGGVLRPWREPRQILEFGIEPGNYVLFLGRFSPEKGCHLLVVAFEQLQTDAKLVMAGASSYCDAYSRELRRHASDRIRMLDWVSGETLDELITNAMIFVLPSDLEGLSLALLDAMGAGLCVVTSDVPENREVVEGAGFTFECGNARDLAERLRFLIANPAVREAAGRTARRRIEDRYQWRNVALDIEKAYYEMMGWGNGEASTAKQASATVTHTAAVPVERAG